jgi:hypothetical protein
MAANKFLPALLLVLWFAAGCQPHGSFVAAPTFDPPTFRPSATPTQSSPAIPRVQIPTVQGPLLQGGALTPRVAPRAWTHIVIHHSDTAYGSAARFDRAHRAKGWDMLGYDFVIGNGTETKDGLIEVGPRWTLQMRGAHTGTKDQRYNDYGVGICLVGNFEVSRPTDLQMESLARLCAYLMKTYRIPAKNIVGHRDCKPTDCPGRYLDLNAVRSRALYYYRAGTF